MPQLIAGNWKMHGLTADAVALARGVVAGAAGLPCELLVCPPFVHLPAVAQVVAGSPVALGGQDCHQAKQGAHTGDISAPMLRDVGASWVVLGHSERRQNHGETDELVREKVLAAVGGRPDPDRLRRRDRGPARRRAGDRGGRAGSSPAACPSRFTGVVAYEPIWAIGTGKNATDQDVATMHAFIREELVRQFGEAGQGIRILYGGSVRPGQRRVAAGGAACRRRADRRGQPEGRRTSWRLPGRPAGLVARS